MGENMFKKLFLQIYANSQWLYPVSDRIVLIIPGPTRVCSSGSDRIRIHNTGIRRTSGILITVAQGKREFKGTVAARLDHYESGTIG
jgi:hypothetical protein